MGPWGRRGGGREGRRGQSTPLYPPRPSPGREAERSKADVEANPRELTSQQKRRIEENKEEARRRKRKKLGAHDPFAENLEQPDEGTDIWDTGQTAECSSSSIRPLSQAANHLISSSKLKEVKAGADNVWRQHLEASTRVSQLVDTRPVILDTAAINPALKRFAVHPSHNTYSNRSIVFCWRCGYWGAMKTMKLQEQCPLKPMHSKGAHTLSRMRRGLHPEAKVKLWPDGHDARIPSQPVPVDWS